MDLGRFLKNLIVHAHRSYPLLLPFVAEIEKHFVHIFWLVRQWITTVLNEKDVHFFASFLTATKIIVKNVSFTLFCIHAFQTNISWMLLKDLTQNFSSVGLDKNVPLSIFVVSYLLQLEKIITMAQKVDSARGYNLLVNKTRLPVGDGATSMVCRISLLFNVNHLCGQCCLDQFPDFALFLNITTT